MKRETAIAIANYLPNTKALEVYVEDRVSGIHKMLEQAETLQDMTRYQGSIQELKRILEIKTMADKVLQQELINGRTQGNTTPR